MQKLSAYNLAQNNNCGLITCSICGRSYRITEFGTDADCQSKTRKDDPLVSKMKVKEFLQAIPGIGGAKADKIMHDVDIPGNRRLGGLGIRQAEALLEYLS